MRIIIYGAGESARKAFSFLGFGRISKFASCDGKEREIYGKEVISYAEMINEYRNNNEIIIVIASEKYYAVMEGNLINDEIKRYFVFHESDQWQINDVLPVIDLYGKRIWKTYNEILSKHDLRGCRNIGIYGDNKFLPYLLIELFVHAPKSTVWILSEKKEGEFLGCKFTKLDNAKSLDTIILNVKHNDEISKFFREGHWSVIDIYELDFQESMLNCKEIEKYRNVHQGKRCFIVATGPSLRIDDLNKLYENHEICLSVNKIYRCYDKTKWRADYVGMTDPKIVADVIKDLNNGVEMPQRMFIGDNSVHAELMEYVENAEYFHLNYRDSNPKVPLFSDDMSKGAYMGCTVTYDFALQMAAYMGFSKIYLLGVDHGMIGKISDSQNHFIENYYTEDEKNEKHFNPSNWEGATRAYQTAEKYSRQHGFRIYNATRGGQLEVFERVDFDSLF
ncbi:MAG: 6-hydroxymethylpterin diphosphokinase MptE-like protein [Acetatifactor sp.]